MPKPISLWIKLPFTLLTLLVIVSYYRHFGLSNFLWFSDLALFMICIELWLQTGWLTSMLVVGVLLYESGWCIIFLTKLAFADFTPGLGIDVFNTSLPPLIRYLTLFHLLLPPFIIWLLVRLGYDRRGLRYQVAFAIVIMFCCYCFTDPSLDINWAFGLGNQVQTALPPLLYLITMMTVMFFIAYLPMHLLMCKLCESKRIYFIAERMSTRVETSNP